MIGSAGGGAGDGAVAGAGGGAAGGRAGAGRGPDAGTDAVRDPVLGEFRRQPYAPEGGGAVYALMSELDGRRVGLSFEVPEGGDVPAGLGVLRGAVARRAELCREAAHAVVRSLGDEPPTPAELAEAERDLPLQEFAATADGGLVVHLTDACGEHLLDGYWPAVRFAPGGGVTVTIEA